MSQDLLDKQIEILERKYGGLRARTAAYTIQRAFRRYTLLKKFSAITAMAKAEKRISAKATTTVVTTTNGVTTIGVDPQSMILYCLLSYKKYISVDYNMPILFFFR